MDKNVDAIISLRKLKVVCLIGTEPHERLEEQTIEIDVDLAPVDSKACLSDHLDDAIDYTIVAKICEETATNGKFRLIEALAYAIGGRLATRFKTKWIKVIVNKPLPLQHLESSVAEVLIHS
ncbi:MAG: dihydroneopterin aldolase [Parachlamydiales bacterium]